MIIIKSLCWVTPDYFLDTDVYVMRFLSNYFKINWIITKKKGDILSYQGLINDISKKPNIQIDIFELSGKSYGFKGFQYFYRLQKKTKHADIVYQPSRFLYTLPFMVLFGNRRNTVLPIHNVRTPKGGSHYIINKIYTAIAIRYFHNYVTFSQSQQNLLLSINKKANVLYAPFMLKDYGRPTVMRQNNLVTFLSFGNIRRYKRIDVLIDAAQRVYEDTSMKFRVIIAGSCPDWSVYQQRIKYPELFDLRIGRVKDEYIPNLFVECDYFVTPYQDIAQSGSLIVGINYNKPIIASKLEAFEEYVEDKKNGFLIKPADVDDLTHVMKIVILNHQEMYPMLRANQKKMIDAKFNDKVIIDKYVQFLSDISK